MADGAGSSRAVLHFDAASDMRRGRAKISGGFSGKIALIGTPRKRLVKVNRR
jgi:hypothetical protein